MLNHFLLFAAATLIGIAAHAKPADSCECPELKCNPCENQVNTKFVAEKCGPGGTQVRSCKKPVCKLMDPLPEMCLAKYGKKSKKKSVSSVKRKKSEEVALKRVRVHVGVVMLARGNAWVTPESGKPKKAKVGLKLYERDIVETGKGGKVRVMFKDKNILNVTPETKAQIAAMKSKGSPTDRTMIDLLYGKIRSKVNKRYKGNQSNYYRVRTKAAVAGVRGTDFVVSYFEGANIETQIKTIEGNVALAKRTHKDDEGMHLHGADAKHRVEVPKGTHAKFVIDRDSVGTDVFTEDDIQSFVARGYLTPVYQLSEKELKILDTETDFLEEDRSIASVKQSNVCKSPQAPFNHCAWVCKGNSAGSSKCNTKLPGVKCVRKRCNANGQWAEETRLPASYSGYCDGRKPIVKACDY